MSYVYQNFFVKGETTVTITGADSQLVLEENTLRKYLCIFNRGTSAVYFKTTTPHATTEGIIIGPKALYEPAYVPVNAIYLKTSSGSNDCYIMWG